MLALPCSAGVDECLPGSRSAAERNAGHIRVYAGSGWEVFAELLGLLTLYARHPEVLAHGHQGERVMFSPPGHVTKEGFFGIDGLRIFMPSEAFATLVRELSMRCAEGALAQALTGLRGLYGDL